MSLEFWRYQGLVGIRGPSFDFDRGPNYDLGVLSRTEYEVVLGAQVGITHMSHIKSNDKVGDLFKGKSLSNKYACHLSLSVVALGAIGFVLEVFNMLEYIKGMNHTVW